jgi:diguanylate cyclase (GGDEF)-like protein
VSRDRSDPRRTIDESVDVDDPHSTLETLRTPADLADARLHTLAEGLGVRRYDAPACLLEVYGDEVGRRIDLRSPPYRIGRIEGNAIIVRSGSVSRHHAEIRLGDYGYVVTDQGSTNGTFVNDARVHDAPLSHGDYLKIGSTVFKFLCADDLEASFVHEMERLGRLDGLTQLLRGDAFVELLEDRLRHARATGTELSVVAIEVDALDELRGRFGAGAADRVLSLLAGLLQQRIRQTDILARLDDTRFVLLLEATGATGAGLVTEKLRRFVALSTFRYNDTPMPVRIHAGIATAARATPTTARPLLETAIAALVATA